MVWLVGMIEIIEKKSIYYLNWENIAILERKILEFYEEFLFELILQYLLLLKQKAGTVIDRVEGKCVWNDLETSFG